MNLIAFGPIIVFAVVIGTMYFGDVRRPKPAMAPIAEPARADDKSEPEYVDSHLGIAVFAKAGSLPANGYLVGYAADFDMAANMVASAAREWRLTWRRREANGEFPDVPPLSVGLWDRQRQAWVRLDGTNLPEGKDYLPVSVTIHHGNQNIER